MSKQLNWDAYRYVLDDPTLDRSAFEVRMLDDVDLALAVSEAMLHIDSLRAASCMAPSTETGSISASHHAAAEGGWQLASLATLAAALLLAIGMLNYQLVHTFLHGTASVPSHHLAESWLAIRQTEIVDQSSNLVDGSSNLIAVREEDSTPEATEFVGVEHSADSDWLMDAAREFYAQGDAG